MFDLERAISDWRHQTTTSGIKSNAILDELENHLREEIRMLTSTGVPESEAFQLAISRLGGSASLRAEFNKLSNAFAGRLLRGLFPWAGLMLVLGIVLTATVLPEGQRLLLMVHMLALTVGYGAAFVAGVLGIYYFSLRCIRKDKAARQPALSRIAMFSIRAAACLITTALVLGMVWSAKNRGLWLSGDPREIGALGALVWVGCVSLLQRFRPVNDDATMLLCIAGNVVVGLAWFGAGLMAHDEGIGSSWLLDGALALNLLFVALGALPLVGSWMRRNVYV